MKLDKVLCCMFLFSFLADILSTLGMKGHFCIVRVRI